MITKITSTTPDSEIVTSRVVNAPIKMAFEAWANPNHLKNWWGPNGFTNTLTSSILESAAHGVLLCMGPTKAITTMNANLLK